jgi:hypothetical protein
MTPSPSFRLLSPDEVRQRHARRTQTLTKIHVRKAWIRENLRASYDRMVDFTIKAKNKLTESSLKGTDCCASFRSLIVQPANLRAGVKMNKLMVKSGE